MEGVGGGKGYTSITLSIFCKKLKFFGNSVTTP